MIYLISFNFIQFKKHIKLGKGLPYSSWFISLFVSLCQVPSVGFQWELVQYWMTCYVQSALVRVMLLLIDVSIYIIYYWGEIDSELSIWICFLDNVDVLMGVWPFSNTSEMHLHEALDT